MKYKLIKNPMSDAATRAAYNKLATDTFGLSFEGWYQSGYFDGSHIPYTLFDGDMSVANISINLMDVMYQGKMRKYIQLGTVMTKPEYRGIGLQKDIFNEILADYGDKFDSMFLFANKNVLDFYPKLGFEKAVEYSFEKEIVPSAGNVKKLNMENASDLALFKKYYEMGNSFSALEIKNGIALEMFYLGGLYSDNVFYLPDFDCVVVCEAGENSLVCLDILGGKKYCLKEIAAVFGKERLIMGFTPKYITDFEIKELQNDDTTLFVFEKCENIFSDSKLLFPLISHT